MKTLIEKLALHMRREDASDDAILVAAHDMFGREGYMIAHDLFERSPTDESSRTLEPNHLCRTEGTTRVPNVWELGK